MKNGLGWSVPRTSRYEDPIIELCEAMGCSSYGKEFENKIFSMFPYYWGDCTCGFDDRASEWHESNTHRQPCYQVRYRTELTLADQEIGYVEYSSLSDAFFVDSEDIEMGGQVIGVGTIMTPRRDPERVEKYNLHHAADERIRKRLCGEMGLSFIFGSAVHCTCDHKDRWRAFLDENDHSSDCPIVRPNFVHKPSALQLEWYKYPLRGSCMNREVSPKEWRAIIGECIESIEEAVH